MKIQPLFIFSLPRSGSTLLQRILTAHPEISSKAEPWFLLPLLLGTQPGPLYTPYHHDVAGVAIESFLTELPGGRHDYLEMVAETAIQMYQKNSEPESRYFIDKTPRYHLVCDEIVQMFPEGKFVLLWRNPLGVVSSHINSYNKGLFGFETIKIDLYQGLQNLIDLQNKYSEKIHVVNYERLVTHTDTVLQQLWNYLEIPDYPKAANLFNRVDFKSTVGDQKGIKKFNSISNASVDYWKGSFRSPILKSWAKSYLKWIGSNRLNAMGYSFNDTMKSLCAPTVNPMRLFLEIIPYLSWKLCTTFESLIIKHRVQDCIQGNRWYMHR